METTLQVPEKIKVHHSITIDGTDVELTRFVEFINDKWYKEFYNLIAFENLTWDNGNNTLRFTSNTQKKSLVKYVKELSIAYPDMFMMYDYYTAEGEDPFEEGVFWIYNGEVNTDRKEFFKEA